MGRPKKYKEIEDIDPIQGVTVQQLLTQAEYLVTTLKEINGLDEDEVQIAVHDAVMSVHRKMLAGEVPMFNYRDFKGYFFIALKNAVIYRYQKRGIKSNLTTVEFDSSVNDSEQRADDELTIKSFFSVLKDKMVRDIAMMLYSGHNQREIQRLTGINATKMYAKMKILRAHYKAYFRD